MNVPADEPATPSTTWLNMTTSANNPIDDGAIAFLLQCHTLRRRRRTATVAVSQPALDAPRPLPRRPSQTCGRPPSSTPQDASSPSLLVRAPGPRGHLAAAVVQHSEVKPQVLAEELHAARLSVRCSSRCSSVNLSAAPPPPSSLSLARLRLRCDRRCCNCCGCLCCCAPAPCACTPLGPSPAGAAKAAPLSPGRLYTPSLSLTRA